MTLLNATPRDRLVDARGRPYFLWDVDMTLETFRERLDDPDPEISGDFLGKLMRQAKPDDVLSLVSIDRVDAGWPALVPYLGDTRAFWEWLIDWWRLRRDAR